MNLENEWRFYLRRLHTRASLTAQATGRPAVYPAYPILRLPNKPISGVGDYLLCVRNRWNRYLRFPIWRVQQCFWSIREHGFLFEIVRWWFYIVKGINFKIAIALVNSKFRNAQTLEIETSFDKINDKRRLVKVSRSFSRDVHMLTQKAHA